MERYALAAHPRAARRCTIRRSPVPERPGAKQARTIVTNRSCHSRLRTNVSSTNESCEVEEVQPPRVHSQARDECGTSRSAYHRHALRRGVCTLAFRKIWVGSGFGLRRRVTSIVTVIDVSESTWPGSVISHYDFKRMRSNFRVSAGKRV